MYSKYIIFTLAMSSRKRNVTVWSLSVRPSVTSAFGIPTVTHQGAACDMAGVHFSPKISRTDILVLLPPTII